MIKKILLIFFVAIVLLSILSFYQNNTPKIIISSLSKKDDIGGGDLVYRVNLFGIFPVADAVFARERTEEYHGQQVYHLSAEAHPLKIFAKLYPASGLLDSYIDKENGNPLLFRQKTVIPNKEPIDKEVFYDQKKGIMTIAGVERQILPNTRDPLSIIFNIRRMNFSDIKDIEMSLNTNQKNYVLQSTVTKEDISINQKKHKLIVIDSIIRRRDKNLYHKSNVNITLLETPEGNMPILIKIFASGFFLSAKLIEVK